MLSDKLRDIAIDQPIRLFAIPDLSVNCTVWDKRLGDVFKSFVEAGILFNTHGTNASSERWVVNLELTDQVRKILSDSKITFDVENHFPRLY